ncbi:MAG: response regulator [Anaerolineaceae bacterium]|nr:response regulator [Anaerolineaceae bacterium]
MTRILVIEDEAPIRDEVVDWLLFEGYDVRGVGNGRLGIEAIYQESPDLIICDIAMPEMDGHQVLLEIRSNVNFAHIPFIFLTASADRDSVRKGMNLGADDYLTKPFTHSEVMNAVRSRLDLKLIQEAQWQNRIDMLNSALIEEHEKNRLKTRLVAMFSHDFRNPLALILSSSNIIRNYEQRITTEQKHYHLDRIDGSVTFLVQMLDEMLMLAELESGNLAFAPESLDITDFIEGIVEEFRLIDQQSHKIVFQSTLNHPMQVDPKLLRQITSNLLSNALKYSPPGMNVTVTLIEKDEHIRLVVADQGIGIPKDSLPQLFEPFYRAKNARNASGTGLGLSIVRDCVTRHQGKIEIESEIDKGTRCIVWLPCSVKSKLDDIP